MTTEKDETRRTTQKNASLRDLVQEKFRAAKRSSAEPSPSAEAASPPPRDRAPQGPETQTSPSVAVRDAPAAPAKSNPSTSLEALQKSEARLQKWRLAAMALFLLAPLAYLVCFTLYVRITLGTLGPDTRPDQLAPAIYSLLYGQAVVWTAGIVGAVLWGLATRKLRRVRRDISIRLTGKPPESKPANRWVYALSLLALGVLFAYRFSKVVSEYESLGRIPWFAVAAFVLGELGMAAAIVFVLLKGAPRRD